MTMAHRFNRIAVRVSSAAGNYKTSLAALSFIVLWAASGPLFGFSNTWQMVANDGTNIVAFLLLFVIQSTQVRSETAIQLKLNEIVTALETADNAVLTAEEHTDEQLNERKRKYQTVVAQAAEKKG